MPQLRRHNFNKRIRDALTSDLTDAMLLESASSVGGEEQPLLGVPTLVWSDGCCSGRYLSRITLTATMVYASRVPIDINSTRCWRSNSRAIKALSSPLMIRLHTGTCVRSLIRPRKPNNKPSFAMEYIVLGRENRDPKRVVVIPQRAPTLRTTKPFSISTHLKKLIKLEIEKKLLTLSHI